MLEVFGPSGEAQTLGLAVPNRAFYQLNYTRIFSFCYYTTAQAKIKDFPVCGHSCGQGRFSARSDAPSKSRKRPCCKAFRASAFLVVDGVHSTPKCGAVPAPLHPVIELILCSVEKHSGCRPALSAHRRVSRFPSAVRTRQSGHFLESASLHLPQAALRRFPLFAAAPL